MSDPLSQLRILIVDDNKQMRTIIGTCLAAAGVRELHYAHGRPHGAGQDERGPVDCVYVASS
jgi:CheY-like chemotaxis protein